MPVLILSVAVPSRFTLRSRDNEVTYCSASTVAVTAGLLILAPTAAASSIRGGLLRLDAPHSRCCSPSPPYTCAWRSLLARRESGGAACLDDLDDGHPQSHFAPVVEHRLFVITEQQLAHA